VNFRPLALMFAIALAGCGGNIDIVLDSPRLPGVAVVPDAASTSLDVVARDARVQFKDRIGTLRHNSQKIVADNDVVDTVRSAVESVLKDQGFVLAPNGLIVTVELQNFYFDSNFSTASSVIFTLRVRDLSGRSLYVHGYEGSSTGGMVMSFGVGEKAKRELKAALEDALKKVNEDTALQKVLLSPRPQNMPARSKT
jgi:uncharacterized lipoprotein YajG